MADRKIKTRSIREKSRLIANGKSFSFLCLRSFCLNALGLLFESRLAVLALLLCATTSSVFAQATISREEFRLRRENAMTRLPDGILLLHARSLLANEDQLFVHGFQQNPNFYYFTGLPSTLGAILAIDGAAKTSRLFVPTKLSGIGGRLRSAMLPVNEATAKELQLETVSPWEELIPYLDRRLQENPNLVFYATESYWSPTPESNPIGLAPIDDANVLWRRALQERWPNVKIASAKSVVTDLRLIKSGAEIEVLRRVGEISAAALRKGLRGLKANRAQRELEAEIVCECILAGGEGPSFWPWVMSGPNAVFPRPFEALADYHHLNRVMQDGELVRVDIGCDFGFYKGDVGRTAPVSGRYGEAQREVWNLLIHAYRAGLQVMREGATHDDIAKACRAEVEKRKPQLQTALAREAAALMTNAARADIWHLHGCGLEPGEGRPQVLEAGMVIAFEPTFSVGGQGFYLEDMILITKDGYEILTEGLPYTAEEMEATINPGF
jgi:Xaa-Pro aminopeptidase